MTGEAEAPSKQDRAIPLPGKAEQMLPRLCRAGPLTLDLFHRDVRVGEKWLALFPREFELLWRLAETPGRRVTRIQLLREVWRLKYEPGTNLVEVHVARLRAKLHTHRLGWLIATHPDGGYQLVLDGVPGEFTFGPE